MCYFKTWFEILPRHVKPFKIKKNMSLHNSQINKSKKNYNKQYMVTPSTILFKTTKVIMLKNVIATFNFFMNWFKICLKLTKRCILESHQILINVWFVN